MSATLVVVAHPSPTSFVADWARSSVRAAEEHCEVLVSDLYAEGFDPVERAGHYGQTARDFDPLRAQEAATRPPPDVAREIERLRAADRLIFHFPLWWFAPPAILKGWFDRVLIHGALHDVDHRFDAGRLRGKRALFCVTTGASAVEGGADGREGDTRLLLWPAAMTLRYLGMDVLEPVIVRGVHGYHEGADKAALEARLARVLKAQARVVAEFDDRPALPFNADDDFDAEGRLKPGAPSHWPFIKQRA